MHQRQPSQLLGTPTAHCSNSNLIAISLAPFHPNICWAHPRSYPSPFSPLTTNDTGGLCAFQNVCKWFKKKNTVQNIS
jgi:hypothetical protein